MSVHPSKALRQFQDKSLLLVTALSLTIGVCFAVATWHINFWPTDARAYYFDATVALPKLKYLSQIHTLMDQDRIRWLHGKEILILCVSWMQRLMSDVETLRPFLLVDLLGVMLSSVMVFLVARKLWSLSTAWFCYLVFLSSFWPYQYVLFAKHQPLGMFFFLLSVLVLLSARGRVASGIMPAVSGMAWGCSLFSSPSSALYSPLLVGVFFWTLPRVRSPQQLKNFILAWLGKGGALIAGTAAVLVYIHWPDVFKNIRGYFDYVHISGSFSHFFYNQPVLQQWFPGSSVVADVRSGWPWVIKYFLIVMPVVFPVYLLALACLLLVMVSRRDRSLSLTMTGMIFVSLGPVLMAETAGVAQYGGNYFPSFLAILTLLAWGWDMFSRSGLLSQVRMGTRVCVLILAVLTAGAHAVTNAVIFFGDLFPTRLATTYLSRKIKDLKVDHLYSYPFHHHRDFFLTTLNPEVSQGLTFSPIRLIMEPAEGYILLPPVSGDSIYVAATSSYTDFDQDPFLNELRRRGALKNYAAASFRTLVNSRIWLHEEEILSYRQLILGQELSRDEEAGRVWLLDAAKLRRDSAQIMPAARDLWYVQDQVRAIGTRRKVYLFKGSLIRLDHDRVLKDLPVLLRKEGDPRDSLTAYLYRLEPTQKVWVPFSEQFASRPLLAQDISGESGLHPASFSFTAPLSLPRGFYNIQIYRTGPSDDEHFYEIGKNISLDGRAAAPGP